jgi:U2-associated protein SR140
MRKYRFCRADEQKALELNELKSRTFSHGITKKSKRDLEREADERKKKAEDE